MHAALTLSVVGTRCVRVFLVSGAVGRHFPLPQTPLILAFGRPSLSALFPDCDSSYDDTRRGQAILVVVLKPLLPDPGHQRDDEDGEYF